MAQSRFAIVPTAAIMDSSLTATQMRVLMVIATFSDRNNESWPRQSQIGEAAGIARETVNRAIKVLVEKGYVKSIERRRNDGSRTSNRYMVLLDGDIPDMVQSDATVTGDVTPKESQGCDAWGSHHEDNQLNTTNETLGACESDTFEIAWKLYNTAPLKARQTKKLAKQAWNVAIKKFPPNRLLDAIRSEIDLQHERRRRKEFCPSLPDMHRWLKQERWADVEQAAEADCKTDWLEFSFRMLAENGDWPGAQYGHPIDPRSPKAEYPERLYQKYEITKNAEETDV